MLGPISAIGLFAGVGEPPGGSFLSKGVGYFFLQCSMVVRGGRS
jgi:hypothetical protein